MSATSFLASSATLAAEWSFLLTACSQIRREEKAERLRLLAREPIRWELLFNLADRHGTRPLLYQALTDLEELVPAAEMSALQQSNQTNLRKALFLSRELIRIVDQLSSLGIEVLPYKGLALAEAAYGDIALRQVGDIDLLIHARDLSRIREAVRELGYMPHLNFSAAEERAYLKSGYECAFDGAAGPNLLEVQWAIQPRFYAIDFDMDGVFGRAETITVAGRAMKTPSSEDLLLILSAHAAKHVWARLVWLCDIARIMSLPTLNWNWIESQATALGIVRIIGISMLLANRLLGAGIPPGAQVSLVDDPASVPLANEIQSHVASGAAFNVESFAYFRRMMCLREQPADRLRFLQRLAFTPGPGEWQSVRLPGPLFPLYRLVRLARLAARLVRA